MFPGPVSDQQHTRHGTPPHGPLSTTEIIEYKGEMNKRMVCIITEKGHQVNENGGFEPAKLFRGPSRNSRLTFR
jgi:hypothetical protein